MLRIGPAVSVAILLVALILLGLAPLGWQLGWWAYRFGLYCMIPGSGVLAGVAVAVSLATLAAGWPKLRPLMAAVLGVVACVGATIASVPLRYAYASRMLPAIHDITTDSADPPAFRAAAEARAREGAERIDVPEPERSRRQLAGYPDLAPVHTALPADAAFGEALAVARSMRRWVILVADSEAGRIEASERTPWFGFTDDIVVRVTAVAGGSRIDIRSASRKGTRDFGVNAARVRAYLGFLRRRIG